MTPERPGLVQLVSLIREDQLGRPGAAREAALAAAEARPEQAPIHLLDATYAALVAGEPRAARRLLARLREAAPADELWERRIAALEAWIWSRDRNWYPGEVAAELGPGEIPAFPTDRPGDPETRLVEAIASDIAQLLSVRAQVDAFVRVNRNNALGLAAAGANLMQHLQPAISGIGAYSAALTAWLFVSDLYMRAGEVAAADQVLADVRNQHEVFAANGIVNPVGLAATYMTEGDWYAMPGSSPEALGFDLTTVNAASPFLDRRDLARAEAAYDHAAAILAGVDEPRAAGALALRRAGLAWLRADYATQRTLLNEAAAAFTSAGDCAGQWLTAAHHLLADVGLGLVATTRRTAGLGFDLEPRGEIAAILDWAKNDGSASWASGLGRLLQRAGAFWGRADDYGRAQVAYEMAAPLVPVSGAEAPTTALFELAELENRNGFSVRGLTRARRAWSTLPPVADADSDRLAWFRRVDAVVGIAQDQLDASGRAAGINIAALEWALARARELLAMPGVPPPGSSSGDFSGLQEQAAARSLDQLLAEARQDSSDAEREAFALAADVVRSVVAMNEAFVSFQRGKQALTIGATQNADHWFDDALTKVRALGDEFGALEVIIWAARDRFDKAQARLRALIENPAARQDLLAAAAVRARDYEAAKRLMAGDSTGSGWADVLDRAETALGLGDTATAVSLADAAVASFEERFAKLRRDVDRVAAADDIKVASLYLVAARAHLVAGEANNDDAMPASSAHAFALTDRARGLALSALLESPPTVASEEQLILAWRQTTSEWQTAYDRLYRAYVSGADEAEVGAGIAALAAAEDGVVAIEADLEAAGPQPQAAAPSLAGLGDVQAALPAETALLEYQLVERDIVIWAVTRNSAQHAEARTSAGVVARLAKAVQRACRNGDPGEEAAELAALLLEPVAGAVGGCQRLIVVPYGPLNGLPFHVLPIDGQALGDDHVISYLPAAAMLAGSAIDAPVAVKDALIVGDPAFDPVMHPALARLPGAAIEAAAVAGTHGTDAMIGPEARESAVRSRLADADLVHLAAHGRLDAIAPSDSSIILAGPDELTVSDLVGARVDAELAVLSACDSGRGAVSLGGDVVGLVRGLLTAGARRSVVSLWPVDDAVAAVTMSRFHEELAAGVPAASALHGAQKYVRGLSGAEIAARYLALGGEDAETSITRRRGAPAGGETATLPLDPEFIDDLSDDEPVDVLSGTLARVWAPFIVVGI